MPQAQRAAVRDLLVYNQSTAGGLMGLEFLAVPDQLSAGQAPAVVRSAGAAPVDAAVTVHLLGGVDRLVGTVSLVRLVQADPVVALTALADLDPGRVTPDTALADLTVLMADHNLATLPVVDVDERLLGVITVDDALAATVPDGWRDREPPTRPRPRSPGTARGRPSRSRISADPATRCRPLGPTGAGPSDRDQPAPADRPIDRRHTAALAPGV